jgi:hypothetical protein
MKPRYKAIAVEQRGGRTVFVLEHAITGQRTRIYRRGNRWLEYANDKHPADPAMIGAVRRFVEVLRGERQAQLSLYPSSSREVKATSSKPPIATTAASVQPPAADAVAGASS